MKICGWLACIGVALAAMTMYQAHAVEAEEAQPAKEEQPVRERQPAKEPLPAKQNPKYYLDLASVNVRYQAYEKAAELFEKAIELTGEGAARPGVYLQLGNAYMAVGQTDKALAAFVAPLETMPEAMRAGHLIKIGRLYERKGMLKEAAETYTESRDTATDDRSRAAATEMLVKLYVGTPLGKERITELEARLDKAPKDVKTMLELMDSYLYQSDIENAEKTAGRLHGLKPDDVGVLEELGLFYPTVGNLEKTLEVYETLVDKAPEKRDIYYPRIILIYSDQDQLDKALLWADKAAKDGVATSRYYSALGKTYLKAKDDEKALECLRKAVEADPKDHRHKITYAKQLAKTGKTQDARKILEPLCEAGNDRIKNLAKKTLSDILEAEIGEDK